MSDAKVIFTLDGENMIILCSNQDKMEDICKKYSSKIEININSLIFLYGGNKLNLNLTFQEQASSIDNSKNEMKILVVKKEDEFICPKCGEKIKLNTEKINDLKSSINNIKDTVIGIKIQLDNIINNSSNNFMNIQLKNINIILNTLNDDIKKTMIKLEDSFVDRDNNENNNSIKNNFPSKNIITGILDIKINEGEKICLFYSDLKFIKELSINDKKIHFSKKDSHKKKIYFQFEKDGKYKFEIVFNDDLTDLIGFFEGCTNIISLDLSNFDSRNITNMKCMFSGCQKLKEIKGLDHLITNKVTSMKAMFQNCQEITFLDLSNFDTSNVTNMSFMFTGCNSLKEIKGINKLITDKVIEMEGMFNYCKELEYLDLSDFDTSNATSMKNMFSKCYKLKEIKGINKFITKKVNDLSSMFNQCRTIERLDLSSFEISNVKDMSNMFSECNSLKELNLMNFKIVGNTKGMLNFLQKSKCNFITKNEDLLNLYRQPE